MAWLRRGLGAVLADLEPFLGLEPRHSPQASPVHRTLLALGHGRLSLPAAATFTQLRLAGADVPVTARASSHLKAHLVLSVPRPSGRAEMASPLGSSSHVPLHRLTLHDHEAAPLNAELARLASGLAQSQPGVGKTNLGGWQSADELFEGSPSACCAKLQAIASAALDEAQRHHQQTGALKEEEMREELKEALEEEHCGAPTWHASHAWLNVNRSGDSNEMHMHDARRWSAVYFVAGRAGSTHSFLAVPPEPGTMWLFPGGLPHCVMPFMDGGEGHAGGSGGHPGDMPGDYGDRISVAINFEDAAPPVTSVLVSPAG